MPFSTAGQLGPSSAAEANLLSQSDLPSRLVDVNGDVADVVDDIVSIAADGTSAVVTSNTFECRSTRELSTTVSSVDDDVLLVEVQSNGYYCECYVQHTKKTALCYSKTSLSASSNLSKHHGIHLFSLIYAHLLS